MTSVEKDAEMIRNLTDYARVTVTEVAKKAKVDPETLRKPLKGLTENRLSQRTIEKLRETYPNFPGWPVYMGIHGISDRQTPFHHGPSDPDPDLVEIAEIDLRYGMGGTYLDLPIQAERRRFSRQWLRNFTRAQPEDLFWSTGDGDSMKPTINSGDVILIDRSQVTPHMGDGIWALAYGEVGMIKRLRPLPNGTIEVHSDNDRVRPFIAADGELTVIGRVVARIERL